MGGWRISAVVLACACGPTVAGGDASESGGQGSESGSGGASQSSGATTVVDTGTAADGSTSADTGVGEDACLRGDPAACPEGCSRDFVLEVIDDACATNSIEACVPGGPKPGIPQTTYWAIGASGPVFLEYGSLCTSASQPATWTECSGAADEPPDCACFCQQGYCRGDEHRRALDACELPTPCGALYVDPEHGASDHTVEQCILAGLRDRVSGVYEIVGGSSFTTEVVRWYVFGDSLWRIELHADDVMVCPLVSDWGMASRCSLAASEYFAACIDEPPPPGEECVLHLEDWALGCEGGAPSCG